MKAALHRCAVVAGLILVLGLRGSLAEKSSTALGNPYLGLELGIKNNPAFLEFGFRVPLAADDAALLAGVFADYDRAEAFMLEMLTIQFLPGYEYTSPSRLSIRLRGGPSVVIDTGQAIALDALVFALYGLQLWYDADRVQVGGGVSGRMSLSGSDSSIAERSLHHVRLGVRGRFGAASPGLFVKVPLDEDLGDFVDFAVGLSIGVDLQ